MVIENRHPKVLIVDDEISIRITLKEFLMEQDFQVEVAEDSSQAMKLLSEQEMDVVVTDIILPRTSGVGLLESIKESDPNVQVILITGEPNVETAAAAVRMGAFDYISKPVDRNQLVKTVSSAAKYKFIEEDRQRLIEENRQYQENLESIVLERTVKLKESEVRFKTIAESMSDWIWEVDADSTYTFSSEKGESLLGYSTEEIIGKTPFDFIAPEDIDRIKSSFSKIVSKKSIFKDLENWNITKDGQRKCLLTSGTPIFDKNNKFLGYRGVGKDITESKKHAEKLQSTLEGTINTIARIVETRDPYTSGHQKRVADISVAIAKEMGFSEDQIRGLYFASLIHDLGKMQVPAEILSKSGTLTSLEYEMIKTHAQVGYDLLKNIDFPWPIAEMIHQHHERIDGTGYPGALKGDGMLIESKIICVADVIEAMSSHRPYRPAPGIKYALEEIEKNKGVIYDTEVVEIALKIIKKDKTLLSSLSN